MKGLLYYINRLNSKFGEIFREYIAVHVNAGRIEKNGRLVVNKGVSIEIREGGVFRTGCGTLTLRQGSRIIVENDGVLIIGDDVGININCYIAVHNEVIIGNNTILGPGVVIVDQDHDYRTEDGLKAEKYKVGSVKIGNNVWIGANAVILRNTIIGDNAVIGAGCIVKGNISEGSVYTGMRS